MRIALAQVSAGTDPAANLGLVEDFTRRAADAGARIVAFPEATMCRFGVPLRPVAEPLDGAWADGVRAVAARHGVVVVAGMFCPAAGGSEATGGSDSAGGSEATGGSDSAGGSEATGGSDSAGGSEATGGSNAGDGRVTNTLLATGPGVDAHYHKIHLYDAYGYAESRTVAAGFEPVVITVDGVGIGLTTCYDVRFPELYVELARRGARVITVHASWGSGPGKLAQWTLLTRARALDATSVVAAVGQAHPGDEVAAEGPTGVGGSLVSSPTGEVVASAGAQPQLLTTDLDLDAVGAARESIAVLRNRAATPWPGRAQSLG